MDRRRETIPQHVYRLNAYSGKHPTVVLKAPMERPKLKLISHKRFAKPNTNDYTFGSLNFNFTVF